MWWTILLLVAAGVPGLRPGPAGGPARLAGAAGGPGVGPDAGQELADGALILVGGTLLVTPGFLSDVVGLFCILPFTRPLARAVLARVIARRLTAARPRPAGSPRLPPGFRPAARRGLRAPPDEERRPARREADRTSCPGEVVDDDR